MTFRTDINALRAIAVLLVVLYHFGLGVVSGGFVGVDVFFVISGYLMTGILLREGGVTLPRFYAARAARIVPALFVVCMALLLAGWFFLSPQDYALLGGHAASSGGFFSNFVYKGEEGYFDAPSQYKWLLHTWSLSAEWQFYLIYPLLLRAALRWVGAGRLAAFLWVLAVASFALSVGMSGIKHSFSFYLLPTRMWEMLAGALVFCHWRDGISRPALARAAEAAGLAAIFVSAFIFNADSLWPSFNALLPVAGAVLVMAAGRESRLMSWRPVQAIGNWSYSIYLWHWPAVVVLGYLMTKPHALAAPVLAVLSVFVGAVSWRVVETPVRRFLNRDTRRSLAMTGSMTAVVLLLGGAIWFNDGVPHRVDDRPAVVAAETGAQTMKFKAADGGRCGFDRGTATLTPCVVGNPDSIRFVLWGDSHAQSIAGAVLAAAGEDAGGVLFAHQCATIFDTELKSKDAKNNCKAFNDGVLSYVRGLPDNVPVVVVNRYSANIHGPNEGIRKNFGITYLDRDITGQNPHEVYRQRLSESLCRIAEERKTYAVLPIPEMGVDVPRLLARRHMIGVQAPDVLLPRADYDSRNAVAIAALSLAQETCGVSLIDPRPALCDAVSCYGSSGGRPLYSDDDHLNAEGRQRLLSSMPAGLDAK
jgi:peptidoglycan/LPS O-acetylase OafA/YrhL